MTTISTYTTGRSSVDLSGFNTKCFKVKATLALSGQENVRWAASELFKAARKNLSGPGIKPGIPGSENPAIGQMPVPRRTGHLARSLKMIPITTLAFVVYSDHQMASYDVYVHDGGTSKPRRYLEDPFIYGRQVLASKMAMNILEDIRKVGR